MQETIHRMSNSSLDSHDDEREMQLFRSQLHRLQNDTTVASRINVQSNSSDLMVVDMNDITPTGYEMIDLTPLTDDDVKGGKIFDMVNIQDISPILHNESSTSQSQRFEVGSTGPFNHDSIYPKSYISLPHQNHGYVVSHQITQAAPPLENNEAISSYSKFQFSTQFPQQISPTSNSNFEKSVENHQEPQNSSNSSRTTPVVSLPITQSSFPQPSHSKIHLGQSTDNHSSNPRAQNIIQQQNIQLTPFPHYHVSQFQPNHIQESNKHSIQNSSKQHSQVDETTTNRIGVLNQDQTEENDTLKAILDEIDFTEGKEWLILETNVERRISQPSEWRQLMLLLSISDLETNSNHLKQDFIRQMAADWRQLTAIYWLATQKVKDRFRNRCGDLFQPIIPESSSEMRDLLLDYKKAQTGLLSKAENHLRRVLQEMIENADQSCCEGFDHTPVNSNPKKVTAKPRTIDTSISLVVFLQEFIVENITYPYMKEEQIEEVANNYLLDKQRVKRKLQNMRTRVWKPFVIEKGLVDASYFKAGNQLKKFLSIHSEEFAASNWSGMFNLWIEEKRRANWTYVP